MKKMTFKAFKGLPSAHAESGAPGPYTSSDAPVLVFLCLLGQRSTLSNGHKVAIHHRRRKQHLQHQTSHVSRQVLDTRASAGFDLRGGLTQLAVHG